ncbi:Na+/H+ antiporter subunit A [Microbacterium gorillae]|uniref:Na+/H+ antiporter subunit A n=1 Tax=Microbacterium gorillae TaxID=1231063 RepID=UPI000590FD82|nr:Na+/H+ antiporter subunit A [Microbacterium gorillae]
MLILLAAFMVVPCALPLLVRRIGAKAFIVAALLPIAALVHAILQSGVVFAGGEVTEIYHWIPALEISLSMRMDVLGWLMTLVVSGVGALVLIYCAWYFEGKTEGLALFASVLLAFAGAMYGLVLTDDLVVLVMFWEITSILSYLLIGYYHNRSASRRAALQALLVTTLGGLVMFIGIVMLIIQSGTTVMSDMLANPPHGTPTSIALVLILVGVLSKSAIFPFHFWLPGAMAAPTPVSAYLHAAAMVKAGIYLLARFAPTFADDPVWRPTIITLGVLTMLLGGIQSLRETDLKRILAFGTVSQLGMLSVVLGFGTRDALLAGLALLLGHALFKSALFLVVGIIDRQLGTRDVTELSGLGRQAPVLAVSSFIAVACMVGLPPTIGFVGKEGMLGAFLYEAEGGSGWGWVALLGVSLGSIVTAAYGARFLWGAFFTKRDAAGVTIPPTPWPDPPIGFLFAPVVLSALSLIAGLCATPIDHVLQQYARTAPAASAGVAAPEHAAHLALWHGLEPALFISAGAIVLGLGLFWLTRRTGWDRAGRVLPFTANDAYTAVQHGIDRASVLVTTVFQRGSLPIYVGTIFIVFVAAEVPALLASPSWRGDLSAWHSPVQIVVAPIMIIAGLIAVRARKRYSGVVLVSVTGLGMVVLFATMGAPDLALTQVLVETVTLVAFSLVLRRIPARMGDRHASVWRVPRAVIGAAVGLTLAAIAIVATDARQFRPVSDDFARLAYEIGHGKNVVNVALVDLRGWDTMGELSVLVLAATGVASLVFVTDRTDLLSRLRAVPKAPSRRARLRPMQETDTGSISIVRPGETAGPRAWLVGGGTLDPRSRSMMLEVIVRILFHTIIVVSIFLLFAGHNMPGGGFAGGLVAGMALVMRYIAGGPYELGAAAPTDAGRLLGSGMLIAVGTAVVPLFFGQSPLTSTFWEAEIPVIGHVEFATSTIFDIGVYLVVIGLVLDVLRSLGAEVDRQTHELTRQGVSAS